MDIFTSFRESNKVDLTLKAINLGHLISNFSKKCVTLDTFFNLTPEDLNYLDVENEEERNKILREIEPYRDHYQKYYKPLQLDGQLLLKQTSKQLQLMASVMAYVHNSMKLSTPENPLIDDATSTATCIQKLAQVSIEQLKYIEQDLLEVAETSRKKPSLRWLYLFMAIPLFGVAAIMFPHFRIKFNWNGATLSSVEAPVSS